MFEAAQHINDNDTLISENVIGDDVAQVCSGILDSVRASEIHQQTATGGTSGLLQDCNSVSYSYVDENQYTNHLTTKQKHLQNEDDMALYTILRVLLEHLM
jgi:hypothetical protein